MELTVPSATATELAAAFLQAAITVALAALCGFLYVRYRKPYFAYWAGAWLVYALRLGAIITFFATTDRIWLYWHQVTTGWTALALLWAALVFSQQLGWRWRYLALVLFPPLWSYVAIYRLDNFLLAAGPAVLFLSLATLWTGWAFFRYHRQVRSTAALLLAVALCLWAVHHLDYPFLRARGAWNPWGYYLDIVFELAMGLGILLLVLEDLHRGLGALSALSSDLQRGVAERQVLDALVERPLTLPAVRGSAMYLVDDGRGRFASGAGVCQAWTGTAPAGAAKRAITRVLETGRPEVVRGRAETQVPETAYAYTAALPVLRGSEVTGAMVIVGDARDPFAALDRRFLIALGQHVGAALESAHLYQRLEARTGDLERLAMRMVRQHEEERRRLSRELHDETAQLFSAVKLQLGLLREAAASESQERLDKALGLVDAGIRSIRDVTNDLRPSLLDDLGLVPALRALVNDFVDQGSATARLVAPDLLPPLSDEAELALFRALQEALANVTRHAAATFVTVTLAAQGHAVLLSVHDDGQGLPSDWDPNRLEWGGHMGLLGMRERVTALGGAVSVSGAAEGGVHLVVRVPAALEG